MPKTLVVLGGWTRAERSYKKLISLAPLGTKVLVVPQPSIVQNGIENSAWTIKNFIQNQSLKSFNLLGHSLGGAFAIDFASRHPEGLEKLFLVDSEGIYGNESKKHVFLNFVKTHALHAKPKALENLAAIYRTARRPRLYTKLARHAHKASLEEEAKNIKVETLILWGEKDNLTPLWQGEKLAQIIPNTKLIVLKGMDHDWPLHNPKLFWENA